MIFAFFRPWSDTDAACGGERNDPSDERGSGRDVPESALVGPVLRSESPTVREKCLSALNHDDADRPAARFIPLPQYSTPRASKRRRRSQRDGKQRDRRVKRRPTLYAPCPRTLASGSPDARDARQAPFVAPSILSTIPPSRAHHTPPPPTRAEPVEDSSHRDFRCSALGRGSVNGLPDTPRTTMIDMGIPLLRAPPRGTPRLASRASAANGACMSPPAPRSDTASITT
ncbi:hypothetical protein BD626DRAFT_533230 [Schizophyllum amplum]|uniref:Uncharacterized protein n=1 Tax=Schizophyllum amplum TaxID=97359 RepID=A0A550CXZ9_9AGAR|nr:hypothetical protein BD626DRAFT_533230 [Auriculariopsis ampla]